MRIAIDAQILMRNHARRTVFGMAEVCGVDVVLPQTVVAMAKQHYATVCAKYVRKAIEWESDLAGEVIDDEAMGLRVHDATERLGYGFAKWLDDEPKRNDGRFTVAPRTRKAQGVAMEISNEGVVDDPEDRRWGVGEDPYVIAEALEAGAHWLASDNFKTLRPDVMEIWLDKAQRRGRFTHVPRPFILSAEQALRDMQNRSMEWNGVEDELMRRAIAYAVSRPGQTRQRTVRERIAIFQRFAKDLGECGMVTSGAELERWARKMKAAVTSGRGHEVEEQLTALDKVLPVTRVRKTRESEERRMIAERVVQRPA